MTLKELTDSCTTLLQKVLDLENVKTAQTKEIASLKKRVTKLEQRHNSRILGFHPFKAGTSKRHSLGKRKVSKHKRKNLKSQQMFQDIDDVLDEDADTEMIVKDKATLFDDKDVTIADTLVKMKSQKAKEKEYLSNILTHEEQDKYTVKERSKLLAEFFKRRKKQLEKERAKVIRSKPPIKTQLRNSMMTYLKHTGSKEDEKIIGSRKKRAAGSSSKHKSPKKQKVNDQESKDSNKEHVKCLKVVPDDDKAINYATLDVKSLIVNCESQVLGTNKAGDVHVYKLTRLDGSYRRFSTFSRMLEVLDRQDMLDLHKIIIERFPANDPKSYDLILWGDLKALVESKKRYPLTKEILKKMLSSRLEAEIESTLALELIKFIKLQIEEKAIKLDNELHSIKIERMTINEYSTKIKSIVDRLKNLGCVVSKKNLVIYMVNGLDSHFATLVEIIQYRETFPTFDTVCNMLLLKESTISDESGASTI
nr:hybrid signal transduction histidine kinase M [Tanacetum cinerariifolium]